MTHYHRLDPVDDREFLARGQTDPFTGVAFRPTNAVVVATDGTVLLRETWEALGERYAGSAETQPWGAASGDGASAEPTVRAAALPKPPRQHAPAPEPMPDYVRERRSKRPWLLPLLGILGIALFAVGGLYVFSQMNRDEPVVAEEPAQEVPDSPDIIAVQVGIVEGTLAEGDARGAGDRYEDRYTFAADSSGRVLTFSLASDDFRPDLVVIGPDGQRYEAQASGDEGRRVVIDNLRGPGTFRLLITSREPAGEGAYAFRIRQETPIQNLRTDGQTVTATLGQRSELVNGIYRDTYEFNVEAEREYTLTVASSAFEVMPTLTNRRGARVQTQGSGNTLTFKPSGDDRYRLVIASREKGKRGAYTVNVKAGPKPESTQEETPATRNRTRALTPNAAPARDSIAAGEQLSYTFRGQVGDRIRVDTRALGFNPTIVLVGPDGKRTPGTTSSERASVNETLSTAGNYRIVVTSGESDGSFQISMEKTEAPRAADIPRMPGIDSPAPSPTPPPTQGGGEEYRPQPIGGDQPND